MLTGRTTFSPNMVRLRLEKGTGPLSGVSGMNKERNGEGKIEKKEGIPPHGQEIREGTQC